MISSGGTLPCNGKCRNVRISIEDYNLHSNMFSIPLGGCDVILGTQWLRTLWPILWDFVELWMQFSVNGKKHTFKGLQTGSLNIISSYHMENLLKNNSHGVIAHLHSIQIQPSVVSITSLVVQHILDQYACVNVEPMYFPTSRLGDHHIPLLPGCIPSNIRPIPT